MARASTWRGVPAWFSMTRKTGSCCSAATPASAMTLITLVARPQEIFRIVTSLPLERGAWVTSGAARRLPALAPRAALAGRVGIDEPAPGGLPEGVPGLDPWG